MFDRKTWAAVAVLIAAFGAEFWMIGCQPQQTTPSPITINNNNTNNNTNGTSPSPSPGATGCNPVASVGINAPASVRVGETQRLDATPKDGSGNIRSDACNLQTGAAWIVAPASVCTINDPSSFTPNLKGVAVGSCSVIVSVGNISHAVTVEVVP